MPADPPQFFELRASVARNQAELEDRILRMVWERILKGRATTLRVLHGFTGCNIFLFCGARCQNAHKKWPKIDGGPKLFERIVALKWFLTLCGGLWGLIN